MTSCRYAKQTLINQAQYAKFQNKFCKAANNLKQSSVSDSDIGVYVKVDENETYCGEAWLCCIISTEDITFASFLHAQNILVISTGVSMFLV